MKKRICLTLAAAMLLLLPIMLNRANPIVEGFFNELMVDATGWKLEMHVFGTSTLDGWYLESRSGQAYFKNGIQLTGVYRVITAESLLSPLAINRLGDSIWLHSPQSARAWFYFGPGGLIAAPRTGQSMCLRESGTQFYYLDNTPTLGQPNHSLNATGGVTGRVADSLGSAIPGVRITWGEEFTSTYSDTGGRFSFTSMAKRASIDFQLANYSTRSVTVQVWPESTVTLNISMSRIVGVDTKGDLNQAGFKLWFNYPNPFNPITKIGFQIADYGLVSLRVYDLIGREIATLVNEMKQPGTHTVQWDASRQASGVYFCRLSVVPSARRDGSTTDIVQTRKLVLLR